MNDDAGVSRIALLWEAQFTHLLSQLPAQVASSRVWEKIKNTAFVKAPTSVAQVPDTDDEDGAEQPYAAGIKSTLRKLWFMLPFWRALALLLAIAALTFWYVGTPASDLPRKVAVLDSSMSNAQTGWVVRFNTAGDARFSPVVRQTVSDGLVLQAWKRSNGTDSALALIRDSKPFVLTARRVGPIVAGGQLFIRLEPDGGSRNDRPSGTILYKGTVADL